MRKKRGLEILAAILIVYPDAEKVIFEEAEYSITICPVAPLYTFEKNNCFI